MHHLVDQFVSFCLNTCYWVFRREECRCQLRARLSLAEYGLRLLSVQDGSINDTCAVLVRDSGKGQIRKNHLHGWSVQGHKPKELPAKASKYVVPQTTAKLPIIVRHGGAPQILGNDILPGHKA